MMARALLLTACVLLCFASGNAMAKELERRVALLYSLYNDVAAMRGWLEGSRPPMRAMLARLRNGELGILWEGVGIRLEEKEGFELAWKSRVRELRGGALRPLSEEEYLLTLEFGDAFGAARDLKAQLRFMEVFLNRLEARIEDARAQTQRKAKLYRSLGALSGLALAVVIS